MKSIVPSLALLAGLWLLPDQAAAQSLGMTCNARIDEISFGNVTVAGSDVAATLTWECTRNSLPFEQSASMRMCLFISKGTAAMDVGPRWMRQTGDAQTLISYDIFADSGRTQKVNPEESEGPPLSFTMEFPANTWNAGGVIPIYGRLYRQAGDVSPYNYVDSDLQIMPVRTSYNLSGSAPTVDDCLAGGGNGVAATGWIDTFNVRAFLENTCAIGVATDLDFGQVPSLAGSHEQTSTIYVHCPSGTPWHLGLDDGMHPDPEGVNPNDGLRKRRMANADGTDHVPYELHRDKARLTGWGNTAETDYDGTGESRMQDITVYGRTLPQSPTPPAGVYSDTITVTLTF